MKKADLKQFDYEVLGKADSDMWRSYYNHEFLKLFWQMYGLLKKQLGLNSFITLRLAYYSGWAAADYRINRKNVNRDRVLKNITKFYEVISKNCNEPFDYKKAGDQELAWWDVHRSLTSNSPKLEKVLADTNATMYNVDAKKLKDYAHYRAEAMFLPRHRGDSKDNVIDWPKVEELTVKSWQALHIAVNK